jgi:CDP-diacylglycerol--serine O-phosphatidyltransferase
MKSLNVIKNNIPNTITCLNILSGSLACVFALNSAEMYGNLTGYQVAFIFIALAAVFDFFDGLVARLLNSVSPIGKELDSLSDCISFGLAPSMLIYATMEHFNPGNIANYSAFLIAMFGALRLAKFNVDTTQTTTFKGMPIPANAIFWMGFVNLCYENGSINFAVYALIIALGLLMVCNMPMFSFKMKNFGLKDNWYRYLLIAIVVTLLATMGVTGLFYAVLAYAILSFLVR